MRTVFLIGAALIAAPVAAQDNNTGNASDYPAPATNEASPTDPAADMAQMNAMTADANLVMAPAPETQLAAPVEEEEDDDDFPWGLVGLVGLVGLLGRKRA